MKRVRILVAVVGAVLTIGAGPARAAPKAVAKPVKPAAKSAAQKAAGPGAPKVLQLEEMKVEGRIRKPQAMFLLPRANLSSGDLDRAEPLLPKITKAVDREPF